MFFPAYKLIFDGFLMCLMAVYKISEDYCEDSYKLVAIHSSVEDHRLAYLLNAYLCASFKKTTDIDFHGQGGTFSIYEWENYKDSSTWILLENMAKTYVSNVPDVGLFQVTLPGVAYFIPEYKQVDYFLKINEATDTIVEDVLNTIHNITQIVAAYTVDTSRLKSKKNLMI